MWSGSSFDPLIFFHSSFEIIGTPLFLIVTDTIIQLNAGDFNNLFVFVKNNLKIIPCRVNIIHIVVEAGGLFMFKRMLGVILCIALVFCGPVSAAAESAVLGSSEVLPLVLVRGMDFDGLYLDEGTEKERPALGRVETKDIIKTLLIAGAAAGISMSLDSAVEQLIIYARGILGNLACDNTGAPVYELNPHRFTEAVGTYSDFPDGDGGEYGIIKSAVERYGGENVYYFAYDWRLNPLDIADEIEAVVDKALTETGKSKVNLVNCSMGGIMTVAYMSKYGYDKLNKCVFVSSTFSGVDMLSSLFQGKVKVEPEALYNLVYAQYGQGGTGGAFFELLRMIGAFNGISSFANDFLDAYKQKVFDELLVDCFGHMLSLWALVLPEDYDACVEFMFGDKKEQYEEFLKKTDALQEMVKDRDRMLLEAADNGVDIALITSYNAPGIPICEGATANGDGTIETRRMAGGALVADYGKTLDESVVNSGSPYVSADGVIDACTGLFPDSTWFIKDSPHVGCNYGTDESDFLFWIVGLDGRATVNGNPLYPQFMRADENLALIPLA